MRGLPNIRLEDLPEHLPFLYAEYQCVGSHAHSFCGDRQMDGIEGTAEGLAEAVAACNEDRHNGHGATHPRSDVENAYHQAVAQLLTSDAEFRYQELRRNIANFQKWGGPMPAMVMMPDGDDPKKWNMIVTDQHGDPHMVPMANPGMPDPREMGAQPNPILGWRRKRTLSLDTKLRRLNRR
jgi:hypothetical protein